MSLLSVVSEHCIQCFALVYTIIFLSAIKCNALIEIEEIYVYFYWGHTGEVFDYLVTHGRMKEKEARAKFRQVSVLGRFNESFNLYKTIFLLGNFKAIF